jgi:hypothetical protein
LAHNEEAYPLTPDATADPAFHIFSPAQDIQPWEACGGAGWGEGAVEEEGAVWRW